MTDFDELLKTITARRPTNLRRRRISLRVIAGPDLGAQYDFDGQARIGSRRLADFVLNDSKVSGLHCEIIADDELRVRDLGSKNGTYFESLKIMDAVLPPGESIMVGDSRIRVLPIDEMVDVPLHADDIFHGLVGSSAPMRALIARIEKLSGGDATVLIQGETGTGKERVAEALHLGGKRASGPLVIVDCGSLPAGLIESELFGHERGAFTGAASKAIGAFERASGGTLFLDEIGELPLDLQPKLLRVLESGELQRLGGGMRSRVDFRLVAATNRDLAMEVSKGRFREDLYYRLAVVTLRVPPLRERLDDVPLLASHLLKELGADPASCLTVESLAKLCQHTWPGNVRELRNTLGRAVALTEPVELEPKQAPAAMQNRDSGIDLSVPLPIGKRRMVDEYERQYLTKLLAECGGSVSETARRAGMDRMSIHRIIQRLNLPRGQTRD